MLKVMVLGSSGMAGHMITAALKRARIPVCNYARDSVFSDTRYLDLAEVEDEIFIEKPDVVINCVGMLVQASKDHPEQANYVNNLHPRLTAKFCHDEGIKFIHLSTDCVFTGKTKTWYNESSPPDATDPYGVSKAKGEACKHHGLVIRTSIIGPEIREAKHPGLFEWFVKTNNPVYGWDHAIWSGVTTYELANYLIFLIENGVPDCQGIMHLCNNEPISKYELLRTINMVYGLNKRLHKVVEPEKINKFIKTTTLEKEYEVPCYETQIRDMKKHYKLLKDVYVK